ncbi:NAD(P)/FAD-dependent oxidoreductase [Streptantibioticus rubrisoli]|uniref:FAD-dependent monooxygenase n=1 Tax=Streptantibioticus rubrisoli TaxID=1387313 RepID=A0ABT1P877_9ACTN|nr:FAD-dependent monooxygenase [Streptantibioticus rubrisoli]MCQ4041573.1 FAD-dependent monooxygenase [Streptantibioticus rubrisoli]
MRTALVLGGSMAGLMAARVLSDHAERVVIVEADDLDTDGARPGVPQMVQVHVLLDMGGIQLERWFPGLIRELANDGAVLSDGDRLHQYLDGVRKPQVTGFQLVSATRPFIETRVRRRVLARENVTVLRGRVDGLRFTGNRVSGAYYLPIGADRDGREELSADLVVDATGRGSRLGAWLEAAGWQAPPLERMRIELGYATAFFGRGEELPDVTISQNLGGPPAAGQPLVDMGVIAEVEGGRWMVLLANYADQRPTRDPEEFLVRCGKLAAEPFREVAARCEMLGEVAVHSVADSRRRDFGRLDRFPAGLVAVGDAVAAFNPVYGQGMASATLHASCLSTFLRSGASLDEPAWDYFRRVRVVVDAAWQLSTLGDLALPHVNGPYPPGYRFASWYTERFLAATITDREVNRIFVDVVNMREHPRLLTRPSTMLRVAKALRGQKGSAHRA